MPLCTCGAVKTLTDYNYRSKVMQFFMGLHDSFDVVHAQILLYDPLPALNKVISLVQQEERCQQLHLALTPIAITTKGPYQRNQSSSQRDQLFCSHCNILGYAIDQCFKANPNKLVCSHCCIPRHTKEKCYKLNVFSPSS